MSENQSSAKTAGQAAKPQVHKWPAHQNSKVANVVAVSSGKGGVGKSSVTGMLAVALSRSGKRVGILDADITGPSIPQMFDLHDVPEILDGALLPVMSKEGIKVISLSLLLPEEDAPAIWRAPMITGTVKRFWSEVAWGDLDYLLVDLPPGTGDVPLSVMQSMPLTGTVIVSSPQKVAVGVVKKAIRMAERMQIPILGLVENMSYVQCTHCDEKMRVFGPSRGRELAGEYKISFLGSLPLDPRLVELADQGRIEEYNSTTFQEMTAEIDGHIN